MNFQHTHTHTLSSRKLIYLLIAVKRVRFDNFTQPPSCAFSETMWGISSKKKLLRKDNKGTCFFIDVGGSRAEFDKKTYMHCQQEIKR